MHGTEIILGLLVVVAALAWLANRLRLPYPILLVLGGLALAFVPHLTMVELKPDLVFVLFLPPILYYAGINTSWRDFKANIRPISFLAVGLVLFTTVLVAGAAHSMLPTMSWASAFVLGAIISPPDAVAATAILQRLRVPRRVVVILEGESLVNDATALVTYQFAVMAVLTGEFSLAQASLQFVLAGAGGVVIGLLAGVAIAWVRPRLRDPAVENVVSLLTPYVAYLPADWLHLSGVLSVVTCGIYISRRLGRITTAQVRLRAYAVWDSVIFLLNGIVFILIGLQVSRIIRESVPTGSLGFVIGFPLAISAVAILARIVWVLTATSLPRIKGDTTLYLRHLKGRVPFNLGRETEVIPFSQVLLIAWTQMRGVVSLAAALALPTLTHAGQKFPHRDLIIFVTFAVILVTLVVQGLTLPALIRLLRFESGGDESADEEVTARYLAALAAIEKLDALGARDAQAAAALQRLRAFHDERIAYYSRLMNPAADSDLLTCDTADQATRAAIAAQREMLLRLRDQGVIGDEVLRLLEQELDHEESRLT